jgi:hypothetical protein
MPMLGLMARSATPDIGQVSSFGDREPEGKAPYLASAASFKDYLDEACLRQMQPQEYRSFSVKKGKKTTTASTSPPPSNMFARLFGSHSKSNSFSQHKTPASTQPSSHSSLPRFVEDLPRESLSDIGDWSDISSKPSVEIPVRTVEEWSEQELHQTIDKLRRLK